MKTCTKCGIEKDESEFYKKKTGKNGLTSNCIICIKLYAIENKERIIKYRMNDRLANPDKYKKWDSDWVNKNRIIKNSHIDKYRKANKEKINLKLKEKRVIDNDTFLKYDLKKYLKKQIGETPPPELVEVKLLINKTKRLCKTLKS